MEPAMEPAEVQRPFAWQPLTPHGVAAFAGATVGRLFVVQLLVAVLAALVLVWFVDKDWFPTVRAAIDQLPAQAAIRSGRLTWNDEAPRSLAESRFLALVVDLEHSGQLRSPAHLEVELGRNGLWIYSLFGCLQVPYPNGYVIALNLETLKPWWGAWAPAILAGVGLASTASLLVTWTALACLYCLPAWLLALYTDRQLRFTASWKLAGAALMPGALVLTGALVLYSLGGLDLVHLVGAWVLHFLLGWAFVVLGVLARPKVTAAPGAEANPFGRPAVGSGPSDAQPSRPAPNPFSPKR